MLLGLALVMAGCPAEVDTQPVHTDTDGHSDGSTDGPTDVETDPATDVDTDPGPRLPPTDLGAGFVRVGGTVLEDASWTVFPGDRFASIAVPPEDSTLVWADLDGDGTRELLLAAQSTRPDIPETVGATRVVRVDPLDGSWQIDEAASADFAALGSLYGALDLDGDGTDDVFGGRMDMLVRFGGDGQVLGGAAETRPIFPVPADVDGDGWLDGGVVSNGCLDPRPSLRVMYAQGPRRYAQRDLALSVGDIDIYAAQVGPIAGHPAVLMLWGEACEPKPFSAFLAPGVVTTDGYTRWEAFDPTPETSWYKGHPRVAGGPLTRTNPMGAAIADLDQDGALDLVLPTAMERLLTFGAVDTPTWVDRTVAAGLVPTVAVNSTAPNGHQIPWGTVAVDLDRDGVPDILTAQGDDHGTFPADEIGPQTIASWWNDGTGVFHDITGLTGLDVSGQWRSAVVADLDEDGDPDLLVGAQGTVPRAYRNDITLGGSLSLRLKGTTSNHLGLGARIEVQVAGLPPQTFLMGQHAAPLVAHTPWVFATTGPAATADRVRVIWPSGTVQDVTGLAAGTAHVIVEPAIFDITPASRRAPADGMSRITLAVTPRDAAGQPRSATVAVRVAGGTTIALPEPTLQGDAHVYAFQAPATAGSTVIEVDIDGVPSGIRPRLFWGD